LAARERGLSVGMVAAGTSRRGASAVGACWSKIAPRATGYSPPRCAALRCAALRCAMRLALLQQQQQQQ